MDPHNEKDRRGIVQWDHFLTFISLTDCMVSREGLRWMHERMEMMSCDGSPEGVRLLDAAMTWVKMLENEKDETGQYVRR